MARSSKQTEAVPHGETAPKTKPFEVLQAVGVEGVRYHQGERVELTSGQAKAFGPSYVRPASGAIEAPRNRAAEPPTTR